MKKSFPKSGTTTITEIVDGNTGELLDTSVKKHSFLANTKEEFFIGYVSLLASLKKLNWTAIQVYAYILCNYPTSSKLGITTDIKRDMLASIGINAKTIEVINRALRDLTQAHFLVKCEGTSSTYKINPRYAYKGSTTDRNAALLAIIQLECPDC